tara:strand:+ start:38 stop:289 length:252 start_codon:yes stop_codon:yes gene_type:complete
MSYVSFNSDDIQKGADAKYVLDCMENAIYDICEYDYETSKVTLREGFTLEDLVNVIAVGILGDADRWQRLNYEKKQQKKQEEV